MEWLILFFILCVMWTLAHTLYQIDATKQQVSQIHDWMADDSPSQPASQWRIVPRGKKGRY